MMTLFQRNRFVPMTFLNQQMVIPTCRRIALRFQCYLLMYFKMNDKKQTSCFLICLCCISLQISFLSFLLSTYIFKETFSHLIRKMISNFSSVKSDGNWIALAQSPVRVFFHLVESGFSLQTLTRPLKKLKSVRLFFVH